MFSRIFLGFTGLSFLAFGLWSIFDPVGMTSQLGVTASGPSGVFEMRGVYGGVSLGAAILCLVGAAKPDMSRPALWFVAAYMGGYVIGRAASFIAGDSAMTSSWIFAGYEAVSFVIAIALLRTRK